MGKLPFIPRQLGKWWGTNPSIKAQDDIDILAIDRTGTEGLFCECKYRNRTMPMEEYDDLVTATMAFPEITKRHVMFISKSGYTRPVIERAAADRGGFIQVKRSSEIIMETHRPLERILLEGGGQCLLI